MLASSPVHPTLPVKDIERARSFYEKNLGLKPKTSSPEGGLVFEAGGGTLLYVYPSRSSPGDATRVSFQVKNVEQTVERLRQNGVKFEEYDLPGLKTVNGIATISGTKGAWFKDPDGNVLAISDTIE